MFRELVIAAAIAGTTLVAAPYASADDPHGPFAGDPPGINYEANLHAPCYSFDRFIFGRGPGGEPLACHWIPNQSPFGEARSPADAGAWVVSYKLYGVQPVGGPCPGPQSAAQSPDGLPMLCLGGRGWQPGYLTSGEWGNGSNFYPAG